MNTLPPYRIGSADPIPQERGVLPQVGPCRQLIQIVRNGTGTERGAKFNSGPRRGLVIPQEFCRLSAGPASWMRGILFRCQQCDARCKAVDMDCNLCPKCFAEAEEENAIADGKRGGE